MEAVCDYKMFSGGKEWEKHDDHGYAYLIDADI